MLIRYLSEEYTETMKSSIFIHTIMSKKHMQRSILVGSMLVVALMLSGCAKPASQTSVENENEPASGEETAMNESSDTGTLPGEGSLVESYRALLGSGKQLSCTFSTDRPDGTSLETKTFLDGERHYKSVLQDPKLGTMTTLFDGDAVYSWADGAKTGMKMEVSCLNDLKETAGKNVPSDTYTSNEDVLDTAPDISCTESTEAVDFSVPSSISFTDQCAMMKDAQNMMEKSKDIKLPSMPQ